MRAMMTPAEIFPDPTTAAQAYAAFADNRLVASGSLEDVLRATKKRADKNGKPILIFEDPSMKFWHVLETRRSRARAVPGLVSSVAKCHCCRVIGIGSRTSPTAR